MIAKRPVAALTPIVLALAALHDIPVAEAQVACPLGTYSNDGNEPCTDAEPGRFVSTVGATAAQDCPVGRFQSLPGQDACDLAPPGSFVSAPGSSAAAQCAVGSFATNVGQTVCDLAPRGFFVANPGASVAEQCSIGSFAANEGQDACDPAPAGSFVASVAATTATLCAPGSFSQAEAQTECELAPEGSFVAIAGATSATICPTGTTTTATGANACSTTPGPSVTPSGNGWVLDVGSLKSMTTGDPGLPALPSGYEFPVVFQEFRLITGAAGSSARVTLDYGSTLPSNARILKYGRPPGGSSDTWFEIAGSISGSTVRFSLTDGGLGDLDGTANSVIVDPVGIGVPTGGGSAEPIPALPIWLLSLTGVLLALFGSVRARVFGFRKR